MLSQNNQAFKAFIPSISDILNQSDMSKQLEKIDRIGKVTINRYRTNTIRLEYTYTKGKRDRIDFSPISDISIRKAYQVAIAIDNDLQLGTYQGKDHYLPDRKTTKNQALTVLAKTETKPPSLKIIWEFYKDVKSNLVSQSARDNWKTTDNMISKLDDKHLELSELSLLYNRCLDNYAPATVRRSFENLNSALVVYYEAKKIASQYNLIQYLPVKGDKRIEFFTQDEVREILKAFRENKYSSKYASEDNHSYYYPLVLFRALTGCRPGEALALTWRDIKIEDEVTKIVFRKSKTRSELRLETKNKKIRIFPARGKLLTLINSLERYNDTDLLFPSKNSHRFIDGDNFLEDHWIPVVNGLYQDGLISKYLPQYNLRHSWATNMIQAGQDIKSIADLMGDKVETVINNYLGSNSEKAILPDLY